LNNYNIIQDFEKENTGYKLINEGDLFYVSIDFTQIKGFNELSDRAKELFKTLYKKHNAVQGLDYKIKWIPKRVREHKCYLEVHFNNKEWLHWLPGGKWY